MEEREPERTIEAPTGSEAPVEDGALALAPAILALSEASSRGLPRDENPVLAYLARLSPGSRRTMRASLETIARLLKRSWRVGFPLVDAALPALRGDPR